MDRSIAKKISFFFKDKGSGHIRGHQIGKYLGAKLNPEYGYDDDICIYVKMEPPKDRPKNTYLDIVDAEERMGWIKNNPDVKIIASSLCAYKYLKNNISNEVILIPQHHCNFERIIKKDFKNRFGVVGGNGAIEDDVELMFDNFLWIKKFRSRKDVINGYKNIDIQIIWRKNNKPLKNPLKIINAMSFGIPTIAYPEIGYEEVSGYFTNAYSVEDLKKIPFIDKNKLLRKAEEYHIDNISKKYINLLKGDEHE